MGRPFVMHPPEVSEDLNETSSADEFESQGECDREEDEDHTFLFRCKWLCDGAKTLTEMAAMLQTAAEHVLQMESEGYVLDSPVADDWAMIHEPGHAPTA